MSDKPPAAPLLSQDSGAAAVEFAFVAPSFLIFLTGLFWAGWSFHCISSVDYALEHAARALEVDHSLTQTQLQSLVSSRLKELANADVAVTLQVDPLNGGRQTAHAIAIFALKLPVPFLPIYQLNIGREIIVTFSAS